MKNLQDFSANSISKKEATDVKGGAYNIFCELYIGRQERKGEPVDQGVLNTLMKWDAGLNSYFGR
jgi:hypothetical protein